MTIYLTAWLDALIISPHPGRDVGVKKLVESHGIIVGVLRGLSLYSGCRVGRRDTNGMVAMDMLCRFAQFCCICSVGRNIYRPAVQCGKITHCLALDPTLMSWDPQAKFGIQ